MIDTDNAVRTAAERSAEPVVGIGRWLQANLDGLLIGALVAAGLVGLMLVIRQAGRRMLAADPECRRWRGIFGSMLAKTGLWFMIAAAIDIVVSYAAVPAKLARLADILFIIAAALQAAVWARELVLGVIRSRVGDDPGATTLGNAMSLIRVLVSVAAFAIALIVILDNLGVNVTALIAGLGIGGIAIGLAAQGIFSDLFAALAIVFDRPFRRGDTIRYGGPQGSVGTVERIGLKTTRIRSVSGEQLVMANTKLLEQELTNVTDLAVQRNWLRFGLTYQTAPEVIARLGETLAPAVGAASSCRLVRAGATGFGASAIDCELVYDDQSSDPDALARHKSAIIVAMLRVMAEQKIELAYPTQTTFTAAPDGTLVMPYAGAPSAAPDSKSRRT